MDTNTNTTKTPKAPKAPKAPKTPKPAPTPAPEPQFDKQVWKGTIDGKAYLFLADSAELQKVAEIKPGELPHEVAAKHGAELIARAKADHEAVKTAIRMWVQAKRAEWLASPEGQAEMKAKTEAKAAKAKAKLDARNEAKAKALEAKAALKAQREAAAKAKAEKKAQAPASKAPAK